MCHTGNWGLPHSSEMHPMYHSYGSTNIKLGYAGVMAMIKPNFNARNIDPNRRDVIKECIHDFLASETEDDGKKKLEELVLLYEDDLHRNISGTLLVFRR